MKIIFKVLSILIMVSFVVSCAATPTTAPAAVEPGPAATEVPPVLSAEEQWLKDNQLGKYFTLDQDWAAIEEAAKKEGKVVVYASSSRIEDMINIWNEKYPDITLEGFDMDDISTKMHEEQNAGNVIGDVWYNSEGAILLNEMYPKGEILPFVPSQYADVLPTSAEQPFAIQRYGGDVWGYNSEQYPDGCPIDNWWQIVDGTWKDKIYLEDMLGAADKMQYFVTVISHGDEMAASYLENSGKEWTTDPDYGDDTPNAGWLWIKKLAKSPALVQLAGGDEVIEAMATLGMTEPAGLAMNSYSKMRDTVKGEIAFTACEGLKPVMGTGDFTLLGIANNAPHPNAAKLFTAFALTEEGREPWNVVGNWPGRTDLAAPEGSTPFSNLWADDVGKFYEIGSQVRDFWTVNLLGE
jgi:iron(III) transport system substrate-binding protein